MYIEARQGPSFTRDSRLQQCGSVQRNFTAVFVVVNIHLYIFIVNISSACCMARHGMQQQQSMEKEKRVMNCRGKHDTSSSSSSLYYIYPIQLAQNLSEVRYACHRISFHYTFKTDFELSWEVVVMQNCCYVSSLAAFPHSISPEGNVVG